MHQQHEQDQLNLMLNTGRITPHIREESVTPQIDQDDAASYYSEDARSREKQDSEEAYQLKQVEQIDSGR